MTRITLSDRTAIEAGIYARQSLTEIAAKIGKTTIAVSREIRKNCTPVRGIHPHGNDCHFAFNCKRKGLLKALAEEKLIETCAGQNTKAVRIGGKSKRVACLSGIHEYQAAAR